jgi:hypothetical protein
MVSTANNTAAVMEEQVIISHTQERAQTRAILARLREARGALSRALLEALEAPGLSAEALAEALEAAYLTHGEVFARYHGAARVIRALPQGADAVVIRCGRGRMVVQRQPEGGELWRVTSMTPRWRSAPLGLTGPWLVRYLTAWTGLRVPEDSPLELGDALDTLQALLHEPCSAAIARLALLLEAHISPLIHDYAHDLIAAWPHEHQQELNRLDEQAVVEEGLAALRGQMQAEVEALLTRCARRHPGDAGALAPPLQNLLNHYAALWNEAVDGRAQLVVTPWRTPDGAAIHIFDLRDETGLQLHWLPQRGWLLRQHCHKDCASLSDLLMRHAELLDWEDSLGGDEPYDWADLFAEPEPLPLNEEARRAGMTLEELQDEADMDWLEENWSAVHYYRGLEHRVAREERRAYQPALGEDAS